MSSEVSRGFITVKLYNYLLLIIQTDPLHKQLIEFPENSSEIIRNVDDTGYGLIHQTQSFFEWLRTKQTLRFFPPS